MNVRMALQRILMVVAALAAGLGLAEVLLRSTGLAYPPAILTIGEQDFERLPGIFQPSQRGIDRSIPALPHAVSTDSLGYRGESIARIKPASETRILFTGDSFTYGAFVDDSATVPALLQRQLRPACGDIRVINAGLGGSTITEQAEMIQRGLALTPDIVVLMFYDNDVTDLAGPRMWKRLEENRRRKSRFPASVAYAVLNRTAIWGLFLKARETRAKADAQGAQPEVTDSAITMRFRAEYLLRLQVVTDTLQAHGIPFVFAVMASHRVIAGTAPDEQVHWILERAGTHGRTTVDAAGALRRTGEGTDRLFLLPHDGHASPAGNRLIASAIAATVEQLPLMVPRCRAAA